MRPRPRVRHVAGAVLLHPDGRVLLQHRDAYPEVTDAGKWSLFGGGMEPGEDAEAAMLRELGEEIGFAPARYHPFLTLDAGDAVFHLFLARIEVPLEALELAEGQGFAYVPPGEALAAYDLSDTARLTLEVLRLYGRFRGARGLPAPID